MNVAFAPVLVGALVPLVMGLSPAGGASAPLGRCHTRDLRVYLGRSGAAAGSLETEVVFRNRSSHSCFVYGYPGFGLENARRQVMPSHVTWGSTFAQRDPGRHRIILTPGRAAFANLAWSDVPVAGEDQRTCGGLSAWLQVTPPDEQRFRLVPFKAMVCSYGHLTATALSRIRGPRG
jgi:hypothetical protein